MGMIKGNRRTVRQVVRAALICSLLAIALPTSARADTIYSYVGNLYYLSGMYIEGSFTVLDPLEANGSLYLTPADLVGYSFTDHSGIFDESNSSISKFHIDTDAMGNIALWEMSLDLLGPPPVTIGTYYLTYGAFPRVEDFTLFSGSRHGNYGNPGTWSVFTTPTVVPEPTTLLLLGIGLLGVGGKVLRRKQVG